MSRKSKWIEVESPNEQAPAVARRAIRGRLATVWDWLPLAADEAHCEVEQVHQLRVSTRRATAALHLFEALLPSRRRRWFEKRLKQIRGTAGIARDLDVLAARLSAACNGDGSAGCTALLERVAAARRAAQPAIRKLYEDLKDRRFRRRIKKLVNKISRKSRSDETPSYLAAAQSGLQPLAAAFFSASEADFDCTLSLHEFRIAGKQLRYAMEVFAAAFSPAFREELYPIVEQLQEKLGAVNDHANTRNRYLAWLDETQDESQRLVLSKLIAVETAALQTSTRGFRDWWSPARAANLKARFWSEVSTGEARCA
jgi:CHAD domain-containing protein